LGVDSPHDEWTGAKSSRFDPVIDGPLLAFHDRAIRFAADQIGAES
jgi:hypothetical protein